MIIIKGTLVVYVIDILSSFRGHRKSLVRWLSAACVLFWVESFVLSESYKSSTGLLDCLES